MSGTRRHGLRGRVVSFDRHPDQAPPRYESDGLVIVENGMVEAVGDAVALLASEPELAVTDHRPHLIVPGLIDPHLHMPQTRVVASHGTTLLEWLNRYTFPEESRYADPGVCRDGAGFVLDALLRCGTTTGAFFCTSHIQSAHALFAEAGERRMRIVAGKVMMDVNAPEALLDTPRSAYDDTVTLFDRHHGHGRAEVAITPRFAVTSSPAQLHVAQSLATRFPNAPIQTHLSENEAEIAFVAQAYPDAQDYTAVYERYDLVRPRALFGHCIHLGERERRALGERGASAIHCPTSNLFLGSGLFDRQSVEAAGIRVGIATDIGGGTSYSLLQTARAAYEIAALRGWVPSPFSMLHDLTRGNAVAMGLDHRIGSLERGMEADMAVLDTNATFALARRVEAAQTLEEEVFALLMLGDDRACAATYVAGEVAYERATGSSTRSSR